ncbi:MAG TPA: hypothetical protein PLK34_02830 [Candidatus Pacearchaeota archaeon]|nr:hypothetical protein [Candidatus Pacearchaeota archaeon]
MQNKRGQVTIFIIIAIVLVAVVASFFLFRNFFLKEAIVPQEFKPVYNSMLSCIKEEALVGINIVESQAGYLELPELESGSPYMPFSSQLNFLGNNVPYWYYVSGNNIEREQVPTKSEMESQLGDFIDAQSNKCNFEEYYLEGFQVEMGEPSTKVNINSDKLEISMKRDVTIRKGEDVVSIKNHKVSVDSSLGRLYNSAKKIYEYQQENLVLEEYGLDVLRLYAPVDGTELSCAPKTWNGQEIFNNLGEAIEANTLFLKTEGEDYFSIDVPVQEEVRFLNSKNWPRRLEVNPSQGNFLIAEPVGNQQGLGILGFCYVPYHFVYSLRYPVLVQVIDGDEIFQFPIAVLIEGNNPRKPLGDSVVSSSQSEICSYKNTLMKINVYDSEVKPINASVSYECLGESCYIGETSSGTLEEKFPQCAGGNILVSAPGFSKKKTSFSVINEGNLDIFLDKEYPLQIDLKLDGNSDANQALISFSSENNVKTVVYPEVKTVELSQGDYDVQVYVYADSSINIPGTTTQQCVNVPSGIGGALGLTQEKCFDVTIPEQIVSNALVGGGKEVYYFSEAELKQSKTLEIFASKLPVPSTIEQLNNNYLLLEDKGLGISLN